ncbi:hypothetical protein PSMA106859_19235 [Pseudoalteromonas maricaloris]
MMNLLRNSPIYNVESHRQTLVASKLNGAAYFLNLPCQVMRWLISEYLFVVGKNKLRPSLLAMTYILAGLELI